MKLFEKLLCTMTYVVVLFSYQIRLNISTIAVRRNILKKLYFDFVLIFTTQSKTRGRNVLVINNLIVADISIADRSNQCSLVYTAD